MADPQRMVISRETLVPLSIASAVCVAVLAGLSHFQSVLLGMSYQMRTNTELLHDLKNRLDRDVIERRELNAWITRVRELNPDVRIPEPL